jgi:hypothetical protein
MPSQRLDPVKPPVGILIDDNQIGSPTLGNHNAPNHLLDDASIPANCATN